ncbi:MAG TPA: TlpA disulfide reductase family protein, partial [Nitrolancea sp.]|nr:TlpA disulfide reductase family protein [Nitrolancea sp.]
LVQERHEVADLYYASGTPMAYLIGNDGLTEINRIEGAQAILGVALAATRQLERVPDQWHQPLPPTPNPIEIPLRAGDLLPDLTVERLGGGQLTQNDLAGKRTLLFMFDPFCAPCVNLLPDFARIHADSRQPDVAMIARRDPSHIFELAREIDMPYPIAFQDNWEISRLIGAQVVPAAFIVGADLRLESEIAVGQQVIADLHRRLRQEHADRRLVSLSALLQRR